MNPIISYYDSDALCEVYALQLPWPWSGNSEIVLCEVGEGLTVAKMRAIELMHKHVAEVFASEVHDDRECARCGEPSLALYKCTRCQLSITEDASSVDYRDDGMLFHLGGVSRDPSTLEQFTCECGCATFEVEYETYCSGCTHTLNKDD